MLRKIKGYLFHRYVRLMLKYWPLSFLYNRDKQIKAIEEFRQVRQRYANFTPKELKDLRSAVRIRKNEVDFNTTSTMILFIFTVVLGAGYFSKPIPLNTWKQVLNGVIYLLPMLWFFFLISTYASSRIRNQIAAEIEEVVASLLEEDKTE